MGAAGSRLHYDEDSLAVRLRRLSSSDRRLFSGACAEMLLPTYRRFLVPGEFSDLKLVRSALDLAWTEQPQAKAVEQARADVEALIPDEDGEEQRPGTVLRENALAAVAYAIRTAQTGDNAQDALWSARQLYEAGDFVVQRSAPAHSYVTDIDDEPPVQLLMQGMEMALSALEAGGLPDVKHRAREFGEEFAAMAGG